MIVRLVEEAQMLLSDQPPDISLASSRLEYMWKVRLAPACFAWNCRSAVTVYSVQQVMCGLSHVCFSALLPMDCCSAYIQHLLLCLVAAGRPA
jgi:hypothetical protein